MSTDFDTRFDQALSRNRAVADQLNNQARVEAEAKQREAELRSAINLVSTLVSKFEVAALKRGLMVFAARDFEFNQVELWVLPVSLTPEQVSATRSEILAVYGGDTIRMNSGASTYLPWTPSISLAASASKIGVELSYSFLPTPLKSETLRTTETDWKRGEEADANRFQDFIHEALGAYLDAALAVDSRYDVEQIAGKEFRVAGLRLLALEGRKPDYDLLEGYSEEFRDWEHFEDWRAAQKTFVSDWSKVRRWIKANGPEDELVSANASNRSVPYRLGAALGALFRRS